MVIVAVAELAELLAMAGGLGSVEEEVSEPDYWESGVLQHRLGVYTAI